MNDFTYAVTVSSIVHQQSRLIYERDLKTSAPGTDAPSISNTDRNE